MSRGKRVSRKVRDMVVERDDRCCVRCGKYAEGGSLHHRKLRSQGGPNSAENLVLLCGSGSSGCHLWVHQHWVESVAQGFIVPSFEDPAVTPVHVSTVGRVLLTDDGAYGSVQ